MYRNDEPFVPESLDEQLNILSQSTQEQLPSSTNSNLIHDLQQMYASETEEQIMLEEVWSRLMNYLEQPEQGQQPPSADEVSTIQSRNAEKEHPRTHNVFTRQYSLAHRFMPLVAVLVVALIVGSMAWVFTLARHGGGNPATSGTASSGVYVGTDGGIYHTDIQTGKILWQYLVPGTPSNGGKVPISALKLVVTHETVYAAVTVGHPTKAFLLALDAATGHVRWQHSFANGSSLTDMVMVSNLLYASVIPPHTGVMPTSNQLSDGVTYALQSTTGDISASYAVTGNIAIVNQVLYATGNGISAINLTTGRLLWHASVNGEHLQSPIVVNGTLYTSAWFSLDQNNPNWAGFVYAFDAQTGTKIWQSPRMNSSGKANLPTITNVTVTNAVLYVGFQNQLLAYDTQSGHLLWNQKVNGSIQQTPLVVEGVVYVAISAYGQTGEACAVAAFQAQNGRTLWTSQIDGGNVLTGPTFAQGMVYVANVTTYALKATNGANVWQATINNPYLSDPLMITAIA